MCLPTSVADRDRRTRRTREIEARALLLQRRSALAFDGRSTIDRATFVDMLSCVLPGASTPWNSVWWTPRVHLAIFVHRVEQLPPGLYLLMRDPQAFDRLRAACRPEFLWEARRRRTAAAMPGTRRCALARGSPQLRPGHRG